MMYIILAILALGLLTGLVVKIKSVFFKAKDAKLVKEDNKLSEQQKAQELVVNQAKANIATGNPTLTTSEEIEDFWKKQH